MTEVDHDNLKTLLRNWDNLAISVHDSESNIREFMEVLLTVLNDYDGDMSDVLEARHIDTATGKELDKLGQIGDIQRKTNENDDKYRARIKAKLVSGNSSATFSDVINFTGSILRIKTDNIGIDNQYSEDPVAVVIGLNEDAFEGTELTEIEFLEILNTLVPAGHTTIIDITEASFVVKATANKSGDDEVTAQELRDDGYGGLSANLYDGDDTNDVKGGQITGKVYPN